MTTVDKVCEAQEISFIDDQADYEHIILGHQFGIGLRRRSLRDWHVCFEVLSSDDEHWYRDRGQASTSWLEDLSSVIARATEWCAQNCDADIHEGRQYGWTFRKPTSTGE